VRLRTRFVLLGLGSVVVPPLMMALALFVNSLTWSAPDGISGVISNHRLLQTIKAGELSVQAAADTLESTSFSLPVYAVGHDGVILYPVAKAGQTMDADHVMEELAVSGAPSVVLLSVPDQRGGSGFLAVTFPLRNFAEQAASIWIIVPLGFVLFAAVMSILIMRSINRSIVRLETATRRIAEGDLDFQLTTSGKDRIADLTRSFDIMRRQLKEQFDRGSRFLMGISHDLKTPLSSITGYVDAIRDGYADTPEKLEKYTAIIQAKTQLLESRISALIDYAKQETSEWKTTLRPVELAGFLDEFVSLVEAEAQARHFIFTASIEVSTTVSVEMDPDMVTRALENLVDNAFVYARPESLVRIAARETAGSVEISVENEGEGIAADALPHIFDPLYRGAGDRHGAGFGLGLAIVKSVIASHGWSIRARSDPDGPTAFTVTIPLGPTAS